MWKSRVETLADGGIQKVRVLRGAQPLPYAEVLRLWQEDASFREFCLALLSESSFPAFRWETPPITRATAQRGFEFVLLRSDALDRPADPNAFAGQFRSARGQDVLTFPNLSGDAVMVVPCPAGPASAYAHLAAFVRQAPQPQKHHLWQAVGAAMQARLGHQPVWLSTAGLGVSWLHVRLDSRPKYYGYSPFQKAP